MNTAATAMARLQEKVDRLEKDITEVKSDVKGIQHSLTSIEVALAKNEEAMKNNLRFFGILFSVAMAILSGVVSFIVRVFQP